MSVSPSSLDQAVLFDDAPDSFGLEDDGSSFSIDLPDGSTVDGAVHMDVDGHEASASLEIDGEYGALTGEGSFDLFSGEGDGSVSFTSDEGDVYALDFSVDVDDDSVSVRVDTTPGEDGGEAALFIDRTDYTATLTGPDGEVLTFDLSDLADVFETTLAGLEDAGLGDSGFADISALEFPIHA
jgi:hypothetical protein